MPEINTSSATPEHVEAVKSLGAHLLREVKAQQPATLAVALDSLISAYVTLAVAGNPISLQTAIKGMATVRTVLLSALPSAAEMAPMDQVGTLVNLVLLPDLASAPHDVALSALLTVYRDLLGRHPCCAESHAIHLFTLWQQASAIAGAADGSPKPVH